MAARIACLSLLCLLFVPSCRVEAPVAEDESPTGPVADDRMAIRDLLRRHTGAINRRDLDAVLACLHPSMVYMPGGEPRVEGRDAVGESWAALFARFEVNLSYHSQEIEVFGERAFERGRFVRSKVPKEGGPAAVVNGSTLRVLAREPDGSWRILREMWTIHPTHETAPGNG